METITISQEIDELQNEKLSNGLTGNETLSEDFLNRQIDLFQDKILNDKNLSSSEKSKFLLLIRNELLKIDESNDSMKEFSSTLSLLINPTQREYSFRKSMDFYDENGIPLYNRDEYGGKVLEQTMHKVFIVINRYNSDNGTNFDNRNGIEKFDSFPVELQKNILKEMLKVLESYSKFSDINDINQKVDGLKPRERIVRSFIEKNKDILGDYLLFGEKLSNDLANLEKIDYLKSINIKNISGVIDEHGLELGGNIVLVVKFANMNTQQQRDFLSNNKNWEQANYLRNYGLDIPDYILQHSSDNDINSKKNEISEIINNIGNKEDQKTARLIYFQLLNEIHGVPIQKKDFIEILIGFKESLVDETSDITTRLINGLSSRVSIKGINVGEITKSLRQVGSSVYNEFSIRETGLFLSTFLPFGVGNSLDIIYGLEGLRSGKSVITGKDISDLDCSLQIGFGVVGLCVDILTAGLGGSIAKGGLKVLKEGLVQAIKDPTILKDGSLILFKEIVDCINDIKKLPKEIYSGDLILEILSKVNNNLLPKIQPQLAQLVL